MINNRTDKEIPTIPAIKNRDEVLTIRLLGWVGRELTGMVIGFENRGIFRIPIEKNIDSLIRFVELEKSIGEPIDEDLAWLNGKIIDLSFLGGFSIRRDLMALERDVKEGKAGSKYELDFQLKQLRYYNGLLMERTWQE